MAILPPSLRLRPATMEDAALLLHWRNHPATRAASHDTGVIAVEDHLRWLQASLASPRRLLFIAESGCDAVGTVRADVEPGVHLISWTVAPSARGAGVGKAMVQQLAERLAGPLRAEIKVGNAASVRIAESAGFRLEEQTGGVLHYWRRPHTA